MSIINKTWYIRPPGLPEATAAGGVVARREGDRIMIAAVSENGSSSLILPKGHVEPGEDIEAAAVREVAEEAGLHRVRLLKMLGVEQRCDYARTEWKTTHYFLFVTDEEKSDPTDLHFDYATHWYDLDAFPDLFWPEQTALVRNHAAEIRRAVLEALA